MRDRISRHRPPDDAGADDRDAAVALAGDDAEAEAQLTADIPVEEDTIEALRDDAPTGRPVADENG